MRRASRRTHPAIAAQRGPRLFSEGRYVMGHSISILTYDLDVDRKLVWDEVNEFCRENCDPYEHGGFIPEILADEVVWDSRRDVFADLEDAEEYLYDYAYSHPYVPVAVRYRSEGKPSRKTESLHARCLSTLESIHEMEDKARPINRKAEYVGCAGCGSKLARKLLGKRTKCPLCGHDLRAQSVIKSIDAKYEKLSALREQHRESVKKDSAKAPVRWAVIAEVHC